MDSKDQDAAAKDLIALIKTMTPTFEISSGGIKFTDNGVTAVIPVATTRQVTSIKKIK